MEIYFSGCTFSANDANVLKQCQDFMVKNLESLNEEITDCIKLNEDSVEIEEFEFMPDDDSFDDVYEFLIMFPSKWINENPTADFEYDASFDVADQPLSVDAIYNNQKLIINTYYDSEYHFEKGSYSNDALETEEIDYEEYQALGGPEIDEDCL